MLAATCVRVLLKGVCSFGPVQASMAEVEMVTPARADSGHAAAAGMPSIEQLVDRARAIMPIGDLLRSELLCP